MTKRSIVLRGCPTFNEEGKAGEAIKPGHLVKGFTTILKQTADGTTRHAVAFAVEREELGAGVDDTRQGSGTIASAYAANDYVKVAVPKAGDRILAIVASGENVAVDSLLSSAGDGTLEVTDATDWVIARALEAHAPNVVSGDAFVVVEIM